MFRYRQSLSLTWGGLGFIGLVGLISCGTPMRRSGDYSSSPLNWQSLNPLSSSSGSQRAGQGQSQMASRDGSVGSVGSGSLEQLRRGESSETPASSPLKDVYFDFDSDVLDAVARETLKANAAWFKANPSATVQIEGHCDERGTNEYNMALGARRSAASKDYVVSLGISTDRLSTISYGEEIPVCKESTEACWAKNRRARFVMIQGGPAS